MKTVALLLCLPFAVSAQAQRGGAQLFSRYPFDAWAAESAKPGIRWDVDLEGARLTPHQRLSARIRIRVDDSEVRRRQGSQIVAFIRIEDASGRRYQTASTSWIRPLHEGGAYGDLTVTFAAFFLPGDYVISLAACDPKTLDHSFTRRRYHVGAIRSDPLPDAWKDLPAVEFIQQDFIPYSWYQPQLRSVIRLPVANEKPVRIELLVNITPSNLGSLSQFRNNMQLVIPSMKVLMGIEPASGSVGLTIADINRQALVYEQPNLLISNIGRGAPPGRSEWSHLRPILSDFSTAKVEAQTLAGQHRMLGFISGTLSRLLAPPDPPRVLIVLSAPANFSHQQTAPPAELPPDPRRRVFYLRYAPFPPHQRGEWLDAMFADDIERILRPQGARIFRITSPEQFRKALAAILREIAAI
ncbi:MAG TPA: hypothetical protein VHC72_02095 [Bryobacteraceae bacterium]|nr:hypothetical protein [Bryobacteraceae bacterium]